MLVQLLCHLFAPAVTKSSVQLGISNEYDTNGQSGLLYALQCHCSGLWAVATYEHRAEMIPCSHPLPVVPSALCLPVTCPCSVNISPVEPAGLPKSNSSSGTCNLRQGHADGRQGSTIETSPVSSHRILLEPALHLNIPDLAFSPPFSGSPVKSNLVPPRFCS